MPKVLVCVFCSEEIGVKGKWLDVPGRMTEVVGRRFSARTMRSWRA
jgi:hypothetical protein